MNAPATLSERLLARDPRAIARAISLIENESPDGATLAYVAMARPGYESDRQRIVLLTDLRRSDIGSHLHGVEIGDVVQFWPGKLPGTPCLV